MFLSLAQWLQTVSPEFSFFRVFQYLTFRAVMAALTALLMGLAAGPYVIRYLGALKIGQPIRSYGVAEHLSKSGTPTMGGVLILLCIATSTLLWFDLSNRFVWIVLAVTLGFGAVGWFDDWRKVVHKDPEGMRSRDKYLWQSLIGLVAALYLVFSISENSNLRVLELFLRWVQSGFALDLPPKAGLLWFNTHPAQVFMGDVGALALGGALGTIAVIVRQEIVLAIMGGIFVVEALSVMLQVGYFKYTRRKYGEGRRLFKMAPLHHHFEKSGWKETQVVVRFWIITMLLCLVGLSTLKLR
ncbi:MAG: phospho-N-acetylmuramoyl-pentapeptide-transferase [Betaproteobacteria bacterium]|nr:phospho-N-acetylmuramoyl-pentapeptide-transferase [Betaproteobacteria bacterium]